MAEVELDGGLLGLADEALAPGDAEEVVGAAMASADGRAALDLDLAVAWDEAGAVVHVPAEGAEEGVEEVLADVGLVVSGALVLDDAVSELLDELGELGLEVLEGAQGGHGGGGCRSGRRRGKSGERGAGSVGRGAGLGEQ